MFRPRAEDPQARFLSRFIDGPISIVTLPENLAEKGSPESPESLIGMGELASVAINPFIQQLYPAGVVFYIDAGKSTKAKSRAFCQLFHLMGLGGG